MNISELDLTVRTYNILRIIEVETVEQLGEMTDLQLMALPGFNKKCLQNVKEQLKKYKRGD